MNKVKILILTANPRNTDRLQLEREVSKIEDALERATHRDRFEIISRGAVGVDDLSRTILKQNPDIVHFSGHGAGEKGLALEDNNGQLKLVPTDALVEMFRLVRKTVRCVFLNACYSEFQADAIYQQIDCVIGMIRPIGDKTAIQFAPQFYAALAEGRSFQDAFDYAKTFLKLDSNPEATTPVQKIRQGTADLFSSISSTNNLLPFSSHKQGKRLVLVLTADINEMHKPLVEAMVAHLQKLSGDSSLTLTSIEVGSVKLIFDGSDEGFARIESLVTSRQLDELRGFPIEDIYYVAKNIQAKQPRTFGGGDSGSAFYAGDAEAAYHEPRLFDLPASSSQSIGNISITGNSNASNIIQGDGNRVSQNINHSATASSNLQAAIAALAQLKEAIANTDALGSYEKKRTKGDVEFIEEEVQKQKPDKSGIDQAIAALKQALSGVVTLAEPVTKVAELIAKAWMV